RYSSGWQRQHIVPGANDSTCDAAGKSAEIGIGTNYQLPRESEALEGIARGERNSFQVFEQGWSLVPKHLRAFVHNVVSVMSADGHALCACNSQLFCQVQKIPLHFEKHVFPEIDEIHLIYR